MPDPWMPGATRLDIGDHQPTDGGPAKAIGHITWDRNATAAKPAALVAYSNLVDYFGRNPDGKAVASHLLWNPFTGEVTQFVPADCRSKSLVDQAGGTRTNRAGSVVIQVEALFFPYCVVDGKIYATLADTPCLGWAELNAWIRSWGVPDVWPMGRPTDFTSHRSESVWESKAGWYAHAHVPENDHQDPGSWPAFASARPSEETDVALTDDEIKRIGRQVVTGANGAKSPDDSTIEWAVSSFLGLTYKTTRSLAADVAAVKAKVETLSVGGVDLDALADKVADKLAARLAD